MRQLSGLDHGPSWSSVILPILGSLLLLSSNIVRAQANGVSLVRNFYQPHGQSADNPPVRFSGCWGYVAPDGREYAILGTYTGTAIIDITDSANVREIVHISGPTSIWREMRTWGTYAYVVSEGGGGTQIIDLSTLPDTARLVTSFTYTSGSNNTARAHTIEIVDGYMYLNGCANWGSTTSQHGIVMFNLNNPVAPVFEGAYTQRYIHDSYIRNDTIFAAAIYSGGGVDIIDARVRSNPSLIARITYAGSGTHNTWCTKDGRYVISTDEIGSTLKNLKFWDLASLPSPPASPAAQYAYSPADIVHNVTVRGNYAHVAWYTAGLVVVDIANPLAPQTAGWYDSYPGPSGTYNGVWSVYPYFWSGKIITSDMQTGLYIFRFGNLAPRRTVRLLWPQHLDTVRTSVALPFRWSTAANMQQDPHFHEFNVTGPGVTTRMRVDDTTYTLPSLAGFQPGETYLWSVQTRDEATAVPSPDTFRFVYLPPPSMPVLLCPGNSAINQPLDVTLCWQASPGAGFYHVQVALDTLFSSIAVDTSVSTTSVQASLLESNTQYFWRVRAGNYSGTSQYSPVWNFRTIGAPAQPVLLSPLDHTVGVSNTVMVQWRGSPDAETHHLQVGTDSLFTSIFRDVPALTDTVYQLTSLANVTVYYWRVRASNGGGGSPWSSAWRFTTAYSQSVQYGVRTGWNLISLALTVADPRRSALYPTATSSAFTFVTGQGYVLQDTIENRRGYWLKFGSNESVAITGVARPVDTIGVVSGWNLIGSIAAPVPTAQVVQIPPGIVQSPFFGFDDNGYFPSDTLYSGKGYWVKTDAGGSLVLSVGVGGTHGPASLTNPMQGDRVKAGGNLKLGGTQGE